VDTSSGQLDFRWLLRPAAAADCCHYGLMLAEAAGLPGSVVDEARRRNSSYSAKLRTNVARRATQRQPHSTPRSMPSYQAMLRIHQLWRQYTFSLLRGTAASPGGGSCDPNGAASSIAEQLGPQMDLHGALVTVVQHRNPQIVGISGVVLQHSTTALHVVAPDNRLRVVPLKGGTVEYAVNGASLQLAS
ncbi:Ribonuclease P protein subunit p29, partial [Tetrabaena socialis]